MSGAEGSGEGCRNVISCPNSNHSRTPGNVGEKAVLHSTEWMDMVVE